MVVQVDYDKKKFDVDSYGNLYSKPKKHKRPITYHGFTIDICVGHCKVWDASDNFFGEFPNKKSAKQAIKSAMSDHWKFGDSLQNVKPNKTK